MANLIGRFETQNKRLSISASSPSRSSSVVSHITGDSAKEEVKDKREWPPKSVSSAEKPPLVILSSLRHFPPSQGSQSLSDPSPSTPRQVKQGESLSQTGLEAPLTTTALEKQTADTPDSFLENWRKDISSVPAEMAPELDPTSPELTIGVPTPSLPTPTAASIPKFGNPTSPHTPTAALKTSTKSASKATVSKVPTKGLTKSPAPKQSLSSPTTQPLRPQHTGQSVASITSTRRPTVKPAPVTPQSKTPRSDASRAKTPTSSRSKTPSTGLFAPTAASLARSRNAPLQAPTPTKKSALSSSSMDRLSKPTAASLLKARPPAIAASTSTSRPTTAKTKAPTTPKDKSIAQKPAAQVVADQNGSGAIPAAMDSIVEAETPPVPDTIKVVLIDEGALSEDADPTLVSSSPAAPKDEPVVEEPHDDFKSGVSASEPVVIHLEEHKLTDDLEDLVNLLESAPLAKSEPATIPDLPDDILEIPDEDEKHQ